jgi:hypothetical protein
MHIINHESSTVKENHQKKRKTLEPEVEQSVCRINNQRTIEKEVSEMKDNLYAAEAQRGYIRLDLIKGRKLQIVPQPRCDVGKRESGRRAEIQVKYRAARLSLCYRPCLLGRWQSLLAQSLPQKPFNYGPFDSRNLS